MPILYGILQPGPDTPGGVPYVRPTEIVDDVIDLSSIRRTTPAIAGKYKRSVLKPDDVILSIVGTTTCNGMKESEIEDMFDEAVYSAMLQNRYGVSTLHPKFKGNAKWSDRLASTFKQLGKPWSDQIEAKVKAEVAELVEANAATALNTHKRSSFDALIAALETKLNTIAASKL